MRQLLAAEFPTGHPVSTLAPNLSGVTVGGLIMVMVFFKELLYGVQNGSCAGCEIALPARLLELDHITPRSKGGADVDSNLQLLCGWCNRTKGARSNEYLRERLEQVA